ncbi:ABC superfamily ATP binding cassette transporter, permease protein [Weissella tructae]|uniref:ABC superfamily ATP binding cassette transporter, permease protein n=1 Tax=Weissella tructae TaxID=887702 RepID=A0ABN4DGU3_9LACO|nr:ABC transporter permease [Weissella tructae]AIG65531.1 ABC superfamily ATP binding cassette transporter, permease protein [Weissella tructae]
MAKDLFKRRWQQQWRRFAKYLRYVFNDHAILALVFILGAGLVAYRNFLITMPITIVNQCLVAGVVLVSALFWRVPATFIAEADPLYFMGDEKSLRDLRQMGIIYSVCVRSVIQMAVLIVLLPMMLRQFSQLPGVLWALLIGSVALAIAVMLYTGRQATQYAKQTTPLLNWREVTQLETRRVQRILQVFSWFIDVPEHKTDVRSHAWSDWVIKHWQTKNGLTNLYVTTFLRTNDYIQLWITMIVVGMVVVSTLDGWLMIGLLMGLIYLFTIQVLPIMIAYRQRVFDHLIPVTVKQRQKAFHQLMGPLLGSMLVIWGIIGLIAGLPVKMILMVEIILVLWALALVFLYSDRKAENMFKRR